MNFVFYTGIFFIDEKYSSIENTEMTKNPNTFKGNLSACVLSHLHCIKDAKERKLEKI